ncbi:MAG: hypothetical protein N4A36_02650 [Candidatus Gracilibacteria bacterium]|jgi:hypothetical protein|nr:hypothetical protein [Candidatus Gracilibacteria bacterium]
MPQKIKTLVKEYRETKSLQKGKEILERGHLSEKQKLQEKIRYFTEQDPQSKRNDFISENIIKTEDFKEIEKKHQANRR